jgi:hypothetical protein
MGETIVALAEIEKQVRILRRQLQGQFEAFAGLGEVTVREIIEADLVELPHTVLGVAAGRGATGDQQNRQEKPGIRDGRSTQAQKSILRNRRHEASPSARTIDGSGEKEKSRFMLQERRILCAFSAFLGTTVPLVSVGAVVGVAAQFLAEKKVTAERPLRQRTRPMGAVVRPARSWLQAKDGVDGKSA